MSPKNLLRSAKSGLWEFDEIPDDKARARPHSNQLPPMSCDLCNVVSETYALRVLVLVLPDCEEGKVHNHHSRKGQLWPTPFHT